MEVKHPNHSRPLYVAAQINDVHIRRALVDINASLNLVPPSTLKAARIPLSRIVEAPIEVSGFTRIHEYTIRSMQLVLKVGPIGFLTRFHVIDSPVSYHALLKRPWLHKHKLVPSTYHQCVKGRLNGKPICMPTILLHLIYLRHITLRLISMISSPQVGKILLQGLLRSLYPAGKILRMIQKYTWNLSLIKRERKENIGKPSIMSHSHDVSKSNCQIDIWGIVYESTRDLAISNKNVSDWMKQALHRRVAILKKQNPNDRRESTQ